MPHLARSVGMVANRVRDYDYEHDYEHEHEHVHENAAIECNGVGFIYGDLYVMRLIGDLCDGAVGCAATPGAKV